MATATAPTYFAVKTNEARIPLELLDGEFHDSRSCLQAARAKWGKNGGLLFGSTKSSRTPLVMQ